MTFRVVGWGIGARQGGNANAFGAVVSAVKEPDLGDRVAGERGGADSGSLSLLGSGGRRVWPTPPAKRPRRPHGFGFVPAEEIHAEVCYAECLLQRAALTFLQVGTLYLLYKQPGDFRRWITMSKPEGSIAVTISPLLVQERTEAQSPQSSWPRPGSVQR